MAKPLRPFTVSAPGFMGLNTQDAPVELPQNYALIAENAVIDRFGRIGARKGWTKVSTNTNTDLGTANVTTIGEIVTNDGVSTVLAAGNGFLFKLVGATLTTLTYGGGGVAPVITGSNWQFCQLTGVAMFWQRGHDPLIYEPSISTTTFRRLSERAGSLGTVYQCHAAISAYGRVWAADTTTDKSTVVWSDILAPHIWTGGTSGSLDLRLVWKGGDTVVGLASHNNFLYIFGTSQILIYSGANDPATMVLSDSIVGIGAIGRDTIQNTGRDVLFLSQTGVLSMQRTIQEKSQPIRDASLNVRNELIAAISAENSDNLKAVFNGVEAIYALVIPLLQLVYVFDMRQPLENGASRATTWTDINPSCFLSLIAGSLYMGKGGAIAKYSGYKDNTAQYKLRYYTSWIDFGDPVVTSIFKKSLFTVVGNGDKTVVSKWGFDYVPGQYTATKSNTSPIPSEYGVGGYGIAEFTGSASSAVEIVFEGSGYGKVLQVGLEVNIFGQSLSIQRLDVFAKDGRV